MNAWQWGVVTIMLSATVMTAAPESGVPPLRPMVADAETASSVIVLGYGPVGQEGNPISVEEFARQMDCLKNAGYSPVSADDFLSWRAGLLELPEKAVLLTFEQADAAFVREIFPVLRAHRFPFLLFVDARKLGGAATDLSMRDLQMMVRLGASVGCCAGDAGSAKRWQTAELRGNEATLALAEKELGAPARLLRNLCGNCVAYSLGSQNADAGLLRQLVRQGFVVAFSRTGGDVKPDSPDFTLPRYMVDNPDTFARVIGVGTALPSAGVGAKTPDPAFTGMVFEDDMVAEEAEESEEESHADAATAPAPPADALRSGRLVRTAEGEDWRTSSFDKPLVPREQTRVAVLGYHNFSNTKPISEMRMRTSEFCRQMQYIRDAGLSVITMQDFLDWRFGDRCLPERCILITIDDGWKSVYTDAYPVLKAYGYPFTLFLYTRYINVHGDSMTEAQIREMLADGATIGSHSTNHLYPKSWKKLTPDSAEYDKQIKTEILDSAAKLKSMFGACSTYCYPGGYHTPAMIKGLGDSAYKCAFTVVESKVECTENPWQVHRYMVFGVDPNIFRRAVNFDGEAGIVPTRMGIAAAVKNARVFFPKAFEGLSPSDWEQQSVSGHVARHVDKSRKKAKTAKPKAKQRPAAPAVPASPVVPAAPAPAEAPAHEPWY